MSFPLVAGWVQNPDLLNYFIVFKLKLKKKKGGKKKTSVKNLSHNYMVNLTPRDCGRRE